MRKSQTVRTETWNFLFKASNGFSVFPFIYSLSYINCQHSFTNIISYFMDQKHKSVVWMSRSFITFLRIVALLQQPTDAYFRSNSASEDYSTPQLFVTTNLSLQKRPTQHLFICFRPTQLPQFNRQTQAPNRALGGRHLLRLIVDKQQMGNSILNMDN